MAGSVHGLCARRFDSKIKRTAGVGGSRAVHQLQCTGARTQALRPRQVRSDCDRDAPDYTLAAFSTVTGIFFGCTAATFGNTTVSTPALRFACTALRSAPSGSVNDRVNRP